MLFVYLTSVLALPSHDYEEFPDLWYVCNSTLDGNDLCRKNGLGVYSSKAGNTVSRPNFTVISNSSLTVDEQYCKDHLNLDSTGTHSLKITGIFSPDTVGRYAFNATFSHDLGDTIYLDTTSKVLFDIDINSGESKGPLNCVGMTSGCTSFSTSSKTNCIKCMRVATISTPKTYTIYFGLLSSVAIPCSYNFKVELSYLAPLSGRWSFIPSNESKLGYYSDVTPSPTVSSAAVTESNHIKNIEVILGSVIGAIVLVAFIAFALWAFFIGKICVIRKNESRHQSDNGSQHHKVRSQNRSNSDRYESSSYKRESSMDKYRNDSYKRESSMDKYRSDSYKRESSMDKYRSDSYKRESSMDKHRSDSYRRDNSVDKHRSDLYRRETRASSFRGNRD